MTAVDWLIYAMENPHKQNNINWENAKQQAKEMEKQQMFDYIKNNYVNGEHSLKFHKEEFEQYYTSTYGSKGSDECQFEPTTNTSSATLCANCGREKYLHKI